MPLPRWIAPANSRRVWVLLAIGTLGVALDSAGAQLEQPFTAPVLRLVGPNGRPLGGGDQVVPSAATVLRAFSHTRTEFPR
jgi:hypothetical protein